MKRLEDYTPLEMAGLDEAALQRLIDLEVAYEGIMPVEEPKYEQVPDIDLQPNVTAYEIGGLYFTDKNDAEQVALLEIFHSDYDYSIGLDFKYLVPYELTVNTRKFFLYEDLLSHKHKLTEKKAIVERNSQKRNVYNAYLKEVSVFRDAVYAKYQEGISFANSIEMARKAYQKYLDLAENDFNIASNFFKDAYAERLPEVYGIVLQEVTEKQIIKDEKDGE